MKPQQLKQSISQGGDKILVYKAEIFLGLTILSAVYLIFSLFSFSIILTFLVLIGSLLGFLNIKWEMLRKKGFINLMNPRTKKTLLQRSIMDIYRDAIYFPTITKIVGAFIRGAITKPHPDQIDTVFDDLPQNFKRAINTKGILHLAPSQVQKLILQKNDETLIDFTLSLSSQSNNSMQQPNQNGIKPKSQVLPENYGKILNKWDNKEVYQKSQVKAHEIKLHDALLQNFNSSVQWKHLAILSGLVGYALMKTKGKKMGKIFLYNGSALGVIIIATLLVIKYKKLNMNTKKKKLVVEVQQKEV